MKTFKNEKIEKKYFINKYLEQSEILPTAVRKLVIEDDSNANIELYALADLNDLLKFHEEWIVLTKSKVYIVTQVKDNFELKTSFEIEKISEIKELNSLSCISFIFMTAIDLPPLAIIRFTLRQNIIMGQLKYLIEQMNAKTNSSLDLNFNPDEIYQKGVMKPIIDAQNSVTSENLGTLLRLLTYLLPYKRELILGMTGAILTTIVSLVPAYVSGQLVDKVIRPFQNGELTGHNAISLAWTLVATIGAIYLLREFFIWIRLNKMSILGEKVAKDLRNELYSHLQTLGLDFYSKKQTGNIISRVSSDTDRIWDFIAFGVVEVGISIITLIGLSCVLIFLDWRLGLAMSLPVPFLLLTIYFYGKKMEKMFLKAWRKWSDLTAVLSDTIPGIQVVKAFNQETRETKRFKARNEIVTSEFNSIHQTWTRFWPLLMIGIHLVVMSVWVLATPRLLSDASDSMHLTAGTFVSFLLYMTMFSHPIEVIGQVARMLNRALSSAYRIFEILDTKATINQTATPVRLENVKGEVCFKNVFFGYDGVRHILKDMSFNIRPGEMVGLVGSSGGGKSTITKLIARFYDIDSGEILIDGVNIKQLDIGLYRRQVGMVLQDPYLFHGTIWENISYGNPKVTRTEVIQAAKVANAHNFIGKLPHGYDTTLGERGHTLSGGERQRISIARAIIHDPKILILDEATSAVDTETERNIQEALDRLIEGRTVIAVAHRLSTLRKANRIFVIGKGNIVEQGTHTELLSNKAGEYHKLHKMQQEMSEFFVL